MNIEDFMKHLYGTSANQSLRGGDVKNKIQGGITIPYQDATMVKLSNETLGRDIGKINYIDSTKDNMKGGEYNAPISFSSIIPLIIFLL